jgi:lycopene cyclase CruA
LLFWIWSVVGARDFARWIGSYWSFTFASFVNTLLRDWFPQLVRHLQPLIETRSPALWLWLLARSYAVTYSVGQPRVERSLLPEVTCSEQKPLVAESRSF